MSSLLFETPILLLVTGPWELHWPWEPSMASLYVSYWSWMSKWGCSKRSSPAQQRIHPWTGMMYYIQKDIGLCRRTLIAELSELSDRRWGLGCLPATGSYIYATEVRVATRWGFLFVFPVGDSSFHCHSESTSNWAPCREAGAILLHCLALDISITQ